MTNTNISFELLWETSESLFKDDVSDVQNITNELIGKITLFKALDLNTDIPEEAKPKLKENMMGSILTTLTHLSLKENINVYVALKDAIAANKMDRLAASLKR